MHTSRRRLALTQAQIHTQTQNAKKSIDPPQPSQHARSPRQLCTVPYASICAPCHMQASAAALYTPPTLYTPVTPTLQPPRPTSALQTENSNNHSHTCVGYRKFKPPLPHVRSYPPTNRHLHKSAIGPKLVPHQLKHLIGVGTRPIQLVNERNARHVVPLHLAINCQSLALHATDAAEH